MVTTFSNPTISLQSARALVDGALAHAVANGWTVAAAVCDPGGALVAFGRMDGTPAPVCEYAIDKAWTAATHRRTTRAFGERMTSHPALSLGLSNRPRASAWDGGLPIEVGGAVVGGIGVSGAEGPDDIACAEAALAQGN